MGPGAVLEALGPLLPAFEADGVALEVLRADAERVVIAQRPSAEACEMCVMPRETVELMIAECLKTAGIVTGRVEVLDAS